MAECQVEDCFVIGPARTVKLKGARPNVSGHGGVAANAESEGSMSDVTRAIPKMRFPKWLVTARNGRFDRTGPGEVRWAPFGVRHARQVGSGWTACGQPAVEWKLFWDMPFTRLTTDTCEACCVAVASNDAQAARGKAPSQSAQRQGCPSDPEQAGPRDSRLV